MPSNIETGLVFGKISYAISPDSYGLVLLLAMGSSPSYGLPPDQPDHKAVNTACFRTSTIAALEAMEVPIEFAEVRFKDVLKKLAEQTVSQHWSTNTDVSKESPQLQPSLGWAAP